MAAVDAREANVRAGYVYVISDVGAFGDSVVKIGLTRRLEPMATLLEFHEEAEALEWRAGHPPQPVVSAL